jgi:hypothetical protein
MLLVIDNSVGLTIVTVMPFPLREMNTAICAGATSRYYSIGSLYVIYYWKLNPDPKTLNQ